MGKASEKILRTAVDSLNQELGTQFQSIGQARDCDRVDYMISAILDYLDGYRFHSHEE